MEDKRKTQMTLPLGLETRPEFKPFVKQHWNLTFARQKKISVCAKRIIAKVFAQIKDNDHKVKPYYQMHISEVVSPTQEMSSAYKEVKKAFDELADQVWKFEDENSKTYVPRHLLDTTKSLSRDGFECAYRDGVITIILNPVLEPYLVQIAHYTIYELKHYMTFKSFYSMRLFELLSAFRDTGLWVVEFGEFRKLMDCEKKYPDNYDFIKYVLAEPMKELEVTNLAFVYSLLKKDFKVGKGRKPISAIQFTLKKVEVREVPKEWFEFSDQHKQVLLRLMAYKVSESNITRYAKAIGIEKAVKLLRDWDLKENSKRRIDSKEKYCNKVWVDMGKKNRDHEE